MGKNPLSSRILKDPFLVADHNFATIWQPKRLVSSQPLPTHKSAVGTAAIDKLISLFANFVSGPADLSVVARTLRIL
jgi:hypothetical protein